MDKIIEEIFQYAEQDAPNETCGLIVNDGVFNRVVRCVNVSPTPEVQFIVDPVQVAKYTTNIVAVYHSHVKGSATASEGDILSSDRCKLPYLIVGLEGRDINVYTPDGGTITPLEGRQFVYGISDCLSIICDYYVQEKGVRLSGFSRNTWAWWENNSNANIFVDGFIERNFEKVKDDSMIVGDVIIMQLQSNIPNHAAIYVGDSVILHHPNVNNLSRYEVYGGYWLKNTVCVLRFKHEKD